jgi:hypothetical protein
VARARTRVVTAVASDTPVRERRRQRSKTRAGLTRWLRSANDASPCTRHAAAGTRAPAPRGRPRSDATRSRRNDDIDERTVRVPTLRAKPAGPVGEAARGDADGGLASARSKRSDLAHRHRPSETREPPRGKAHGPGAGRECARARRRPRGRRRGLEDRATLGQAWVTDRVRNPQCAFEMSMFMCPAVHMLTRILRRSSSTHVPSDPPFGVVFTLGRRAQSRPRSHCPRGRRIRGSSELTAVQSDFTFGYVLVSFEARPPARGQMATLVATDVCTAYSLKTWALALSGECRYRYRDFSEATAVAVHARELLGARHARSAPAAVGPPIRALQRAAYRSSSALAVMILPQVHLRKPCYDFYFL